MINATIIISTKNRPHDLIKCLDSLITQTYPISELIIIDAGDEEIYYIINKYKKLLTIKYIRCKTSLTAARNIGIKKSKGNVIIFLDDDVVLDNRFIYFIINVFENYGNDVGAVCGNIINDEIASRGFSKSINNPIIKRIRNSIFRLFFLYCWNDGNFQPSGMPTYPIRNKGISFIECLPGANMAFRKEVLDKFKFDENLHGYCFMEDCDISYRILKQYTIIYSPFAELYHNFSPASRDSDRLRMKMLIESHYYLFNKNFPHTFYNKLAFRVSIFGLFFISLIQLNLEEIKGLFSGLKTIFLEKIKNA